MSNVYQFSASIYQVLKAGRYFLLPVFYLMIQSSASQAQSDSLDLQACYDSAMASYPLSRQSVLIDQTYELKIKNLTSQWFPQVVMNGQANYNSDVTSISLNAPMIPKDAFPVIPHDQYKLTLDVNQTIWDGGYSKRQGALENASHKADLQQVAVDLYGLHDRINKVYFVLLLLDKSEALTRDLVSTLQVKLETSGSGVKNGIMAPVNVQILQAEKLKAEQKLFEIQSDRESAREILSYLTGIPLGRIGHLVFPAVRDTATEPVNKRPEMELFDLQMNKLDLAQQVLTVKNRPRVYAFGEVGYGRPGLNMLSTDWNTFWIVGAGLKWNLWDWNTSRRDRQVLAIQKEMLNNQKAGFDLNVTIQAATENSTIRKYQEAIERDRKLLELREDILKTITSQFDHGLLSSSDYIQELNARMQAEITLQTDQLLLLQSVQNLKTIQGQAGGSGKFLNSK